VDRRKIHLDDPLKSLGEFHVPVKLHREVTAHIKVTVNREGGEPEA
jgi:large subunit ribosomal protein L9